MAIGRPREFDVDQAVDRALELFWRKGYEATSLTDLTEALGITKPSFYAAFGSKEGLYRAVLDRYENGPGDYLAAALAQPAARAVAEQLLHGAADVNADQRHPGCLLVRGTLTCGEAGTELHRELGARGAAAERAILERLKRARAEGDLPSDADPVDLARFLRSMIYGISIQAAAGASRKDLHKIADFALRAWPQGKTRKKGSKWPRPQ